MKKNFQFSIFNFQFITVVFILILAAFLRLYRIADYMTFLGDEGRDVLVVYNILHGKLTLLGPTSSVGGFFLGPIYYYFMAPFLLLSNYNPVGPAIMVALIGVATVFLIYKFCSELFNKRAGLIAASLYAISPLVIAYSRSSWNPNPLPFFSLLSLLALYKGVVKKNYKLIFASGILLGIAMQLHYLATFLAFIMLLYILLTEILAVKFNFKNALQILIKKYGLILSGFIVGWFPFLAFEIRHGFLDFKNIFNFILHSGDTGAGSNFLFTTYDVFFRLFGRLIVAFPPPEQFFKYDSIALNLWIGFVLTLAILSSGFLLFNFYKSFKHKNESFNKYLLIVLWFFVGISLFGFYKKSIYDYYFSFMFPVPFIMLGLLMSFIYENKKIKYFGKIISITLFIFLFFINIQGLPFRYEPNRQLNQMKTIADFVMTRTDAKPFNFALISGGNSDHAYRYFFTVWSNPPVTIEDPARDPGRKTVTDQLFVVCESPLPCEPLGHSLWEIAGFGRAEIAGHWKVSVVEVYKLVHYEGK
ncbi:MAG: glycosyltransferase family 39 protein [Patescibacteria group bacterium]|nr:glycosyltransferase family 39 protein [Patescibacteria group bacterium]